MGVINPGPTLAAMVLPHAGAPPFAGAYQQDPFAQYASGLTDNGGGSIDIGKILTAIITGGKGAATKKGTGKNTPGFTPPFAPQNTGQSDIPLANVDNAIPQGVVDPQAAAPAPVNPAPVAPTNPIAPAPGPNYQPLPVRPAATPLPPVPVQDVKGDAKRKANTVNTAALIPALAAIFGGGKAYESASAYNPWAVAQAETTADTRNDTDFEKALRLYGLNNQNVQYGNTEANLKYGSDVAAANAANAQETEKAKLATQAQNANTKTNAGLTNGLKFLSGLATDAQRQAVISQGFLQRYGITDPGDIATIARMYPSLQTPELIAARTRTKALQEELKQQYTLYRLQGTTEEGKTAAAKRIAEVQQELGVDAAPMDARTQLPMNAFQAGQLGVSDRNATVHEQLLQPQIDALHAHANAATKNANTARAAQQEAVKRDASMFALASLRKSGVDPANEVVKLQSQIRTAEVNMAQAQHDNAAFKDATDPYSVQVRDANDQKWRANKDLIATLKQSIGTINAKAAAEEKLRKEAIKAAQDARKGADAAGGAKAAQPGAKVSKSLQGGPTTPTTIHLKSTSADTGYEDWLNRGASIGAPTGR